MLEARQRWGAALSGLRRTSVAVPAVVVSPVGAAPVPGSVAVARALAVPLL